MDFKQSGSPCIKISIASFVASLFLVSLTDLQRDFAGGHSQQHDLIASPVDIAPLMIDSTFQLFYLRSPAAVFHNRPDIWRRLPLATMPKHPHPFAQTAIP